MNSAAQRWRPNVTVAAIAEQQGRYLLVEEHTPAGLQLNNPAGHLDPGESPQQAVVREALEESTRVFTPQALVGVYLSRSVGPESQQDITYLRLAFCGVVGEEMPGLQLDHGIVRTLWLTLDEIRASVPRHRSPLLLRCVEDHAAGKRYPLELVITDPSVLQEGPQAPHAGRR
jgi:8-oxo-dGTP pyrophosphatase MutT (NUDIX family)